MLLPPRFAARLPTPDRTASRIELPGRLAAPGAVVTLFVLVMSACVLGLVVWKALEARTTALAQSEINTRNLVHSLAEHASSAIESADVAMSGMVELLKFQNPLPERLDLFLMKTIHALPQLREIGVLDAAGDWKYSSLADRPQYNNSDRSYFTYHRETPDPAIRINEPVQSRLTGRQTIILSKRISNQDGSFNGVLVAAIDSEYFLDFYGTFRLGPDAGISLLRRDGMVLVHWPSIGWEQDPSKSNFSKSKLFQSWMEQGPAGYHRLTSRFDSLVKYIGFERASRYPVLVVVALPEDQLLAAWRTGLLSDALVALVLLCSVVLLAVLLAAQFRFRLRMESVLRDREARYRLLADNIADVVILLDKHGGFLFVSQSVEPVLGLKPRDLIDTSCFDLVHAEDVGNFRAATVQLTDRTSSKTIVFRTYRADGSLAWLEANFKRTVTSGSRYQIEIVGVLRDVTHRKAMEVELAALTTRLSELATTDGLTGLANRRRLDEVLHHQYGLRDQISLLMLDIDEFKGFNDSLGHQAGDECLKSVAEIVADATANSSGLSARYGGEEFAIVLPGVGESDALKVAEAVRLKVRALEIANPASERRFISVSVGIASKTAATSDETTLIGDADRALYEAKHRGRNCSVAASMINLHVFDAPPLQRA